MEMEKGDTTDSTAAITAVMARGTAGCLEVCIACASFHGPAKAGP
ncbi:MAG: hypothetical protein V8S34_08715 [Lawsonibacter sp.]